MNVQDEKMIGINILKCHMIKINRSTGQKEDNDFGFWMIINKLVELEPDRKEVGITYNLDLFIILTNHIFIVESQRNSLFIAILAFDFQFDIDRITKTSLRQTRYRLGNE